jgi:Zn-dependent protease
MQGIFFGMMGIVAMSVYPADEPALPARIHIRRALGGPIISTLIGLVFLALVVVAGDSASLIAYLLRLGLFLCFMMSAGALMPVPNLDGGTILYWARH